MSPPSLAVAAGEPAPTDPMADPANQKKVGLAKDFAFHLLKGIKQIGMYRHNEAKFPEFLKSALDVLASYLETHGPLSLKVEQQNFLLLGQPLFAEDTSLPYKFYRDGIRQLIFRPGLSVQELVSFTMIALSEPERGADDVLAQLWKAALEHVEYVVVEGFQVGEFSEDEVKVEVDHVVGYLYSRLKTNSDDFLRFARVSTEDLETKLEGIDQIRGAVVTGVTATDDLKAKVQREIAEEEQARLFPKLVSAVFQVIEGGADDPALLEDMFVQLLDALLLQEDFATINQVVLKLTAMEQRDPKRTGLSKLRRSMTAKMGEEQRLMRVGEILKTAKAKSPQDLLRYLQVLDRSALPSLLNLLESIEIADNRVVLLDIAVRFAKDDPDPFVERLDSDRPQTVRDMVYILEKSNHPDRLKLFARVFTTRNLAVKLEVLNIVGRSKTGEARKLLVDALNDPQMQVRILASKLLVQFDPEKALPDLSRLVRDQGFEKKLPEERGALYAAIASVGSLAALSMMSEILQTKGSLFNKAKVNEDKLLAIQALTAAPSVQSYKILQATVEDKAQPAEVLSAARKAMYQTKKALFGEAAAGEGT